jgi:hypothetical protein
VDGFDPALVAEKEERAKLRRKGKGLRGRRRARSIGAIHSPGVAAASTPEAEEGTRGGGFGSWELRLERTVGEMMGAVGKNEGTPVKMEGMRSVETVG